MANSNSTTIFASLKKANPNLILEEIEIKLGSVTNKSVIIQAIKNSTMYQGEVKVNFRINNEGTEQNDNLLIGYWYEWGGTNQQKLELWEIDARYNVIIVSFLYTDQPYQMPTFVAQNPVNLKKGIKVQHEKGHKVLISMGGQTGNSMRFRQNQKDDLKKAFKSVVNEYEFDGVDIDWEGECLQDNESKQTTVIALKEIKQEWQATKKKEFYITMAPEFPNLRKTSAMSYEIFLTVLAGFYNWIHPQFYNGWADGVFVDSQDAKKLGLTPGMVISNDNNELRGEFYYLLIKYITTGQSQYNNFLQIDADKLVIGASTSEPAGRGAATKAAINQAFVLLTKNNIMIRGLIPQLLLLAINIQ
ncbi:glycosyl hydrolase family 18 protein [Spiroplasma endosymbiont of Sarcophaga carnaria]|uniref:glycosyl hydrolase family 18 protein n=2 Tax=unclassified Spiroplasma TaxID=2637901 RepID=UPI0030CEC233